MYVCMVTDIIRQEYMDQPPGKVANPARGQLNRENGYFPVRVRASPENLVSRDGFGSLVPRQPAHLHTQATACCVTEVSSVARTIR